MTQEMTFAEKLKFYVTMRAMVLNFNCITFDQSGGVPDFHSLVASGGDTILGAHIGVESFINALGTCEAYREVVSPCLSRLRKLYPDGREGKKPLGFEVWHQFLRHAAAKTVSDLPQAKEELHAHLIALFSKTYPIDLLFPGDVPLDVLMLPVSECVEGVALGHSFEGALVGDLYLDTGIVESKSSGAIKLLDEQLFQSVGLSVRVKLTGVFLKQYSQAKEKKDETP
jgi:hypothetical protein